MIFLPLNLIILFRSIHYNIKAKIGSVKHKILCCAFVRRRQHMWRLIK